MTDLPRWLVTSSARNQSTTKIIAARIPAATTIGAKMAPIAKTLRAGRFDPRFNLDNPFCLTSLRVSKQCETQIAGNRNPWCCYVPSTASPCTRRTIASIILVTGDNGIFVYKLSGSEGDRFRILIPMYSVGRCGGTLLSRALNRTAAMPRNEVDHECIDSGH